MPFAEPVRMVHFASVIRVAVKIIYKEIPGKLAVIAVFPLLISHFWTKTQVTGKTN